MSEWRINHPTEKNFGKNQTKELEDNIIDNFFIFLNTGRPRF